MAAGVNYNNVWAALGRPVDVVAARRKAGEAEEFHIGGSDASGIVWAVGEGVDSVRVGDHVVAHCGVWDLRRPMDRRRRRPDHRAERTDLGVRDQLGELRAVHPGSGSPAAPQIAASQLGRGGRVHAGGSDCISHALLVGIRTPFASMTSS